MKFWIVTPSFNQLNWLKLCVASVADQATEGMAHGAECIEVHHHIQDAQSTDGTPEWLERYAREISSQQSAVSSDLRYPADAKAMADRPTSDLCPAYTFSYSSERDAGMYDAINKGWKMAPDDADVIAHLNCDEQYLPGALKTIADFFQAHQKADVVLADMIVVDGHGHYICHRRSLNPSSLTSRFCTGGFTATTFHRACVTKKKGVFFDTSWRNFGDKVWYNALHRAGCRFAVCHQMVSLFTDTGENLNWTDEGLREKKRYEKKYQGGLGFLTSLIARMNGLRRLLLEKRVVSPKSVSFYRPGSNKRLIKRILNPTGLWRKKWSSL